MIIAPMLPTAEISIAPIMEAPRTLVTLYSHDISGLFATSP